MATFMTQLRDAIMPLHDEAEKRGPLREIPEKTITLENYKNVLGRLYGFVSASEEVISPLLVSYSVDLEWPKRKRMEHLQKDLMFFGVETSAIESIPKCQEVSAIQTIPHALGILYLFEGSRLGGLVLSKALREHFGLENYQGYAYFASNGAEVANLWLTFKGVIEGFVSSNGCGSEIITSAIGGFELLNQWIENCSCLKIKTM